jgi:hypothetical protein
VRLLRYFCMYCASRLIFESVRSAVRGHRNRQHPAPACKQHVSGVLLTIFLLPPLFLAGMGFWGFVLSK